MIILKHDNNDKPSIKIGIDITQLEISLIAILHDKNRFLTEIILKESIILNSETNSFSDRLNHLLYSSITTLKQKYNIKSVAVGWPISLGNNNTDISKIVELDNMKFDIEPPLQSIISNIKGLKLFNINFASKTYSLSLIKSSEEERYVGVALVNFNPNEIELMINDNGELIKYIRFPIKSLS